MDILTLIVGGVLLIAAGFFLGYGMSFSNSESLKHQNQQLNAELKRLTDRDSKGRFVKRERK